VRVLSSPENRISFKKPVDVSLAAWQQDDVASSECLLRHRH
jgi:hypothetical protein